MKYVMEDTGSIYEKEQLSKIMVGHQAIENKMDFLLRFYFSNPKYYQDSKFSFSNKTNLLMAAGIIDEKFGNFIKKLNKLRNKYAHDFNYEIDFEEAFELVNQANDANIYFSDDTIWIDKEKSKEYYNTEWVILEVFSNTNFMFGEIMDKLGIEVTY